MALKVRQTNLGNNPNAKSAVDLRTQITKIESKEMLQAEVKRLSSKVAELTAQAMNETKAVREMDSLYSQLQTLTDKHRQLIHEKTMVEQRAAQEERVAKEAISQRDAALRAQSAARLEAERSAAEVFKLQLKVKEMQDQLSEGNLQRTMLQRQINAQSEEMKQLSSLQEELDEEKRSRQKFESQAAEQINLITALREEFHARLLGVGCKTKSNMAPLGESLRHGKKQLTDEESIDAFGEVLKRLMVGKSAFEAHKIKRQLLFCFHPDKNPATDVATRITQILNSAEIDPRGEAAAPSQRPEKSSTRSTGTASARGDRSPNARPAGSPMRPARRSCYSERERPQSARPRCRC